MEVEIPIKPVEKKKQFQNQWKQKFPWVDCRWEYSEASSQWEEVLYCKSCVTYSTKLSKQEQQKYINSFIQGCRSIKLTRLEEHQGAKKSCHAEADRALNPERYQKPQDMIGEMFAGKKKKIEDRLLLPLFANAYFIAKENLAVLKYEKVKQLLNYLDVDTTSPVSKKTEFITIACRYLDPSNEIQEKFLAIKELTQLDATSYIVEIKKALQELNIYQNLYFLSTDGASVVSSEKNGVYGRLKELIPHLLANKCLAHRAALGVKDLAKNFTEIDCLNHQVYKICSLFNTKHKLDLLDLNFQQIVGQDEDSQILQMIKPIDVRWISYYPSIKRLLLNYQPVLKTIFELNIEDFNIENTNLLKYFKHITNLIFIGYYADILFDVYILTKALQKQNITINVFQFEYDKCLTNLQQLKELDVEIDNNKMEQEIKEEQNSIGLISKSISKRITKQIIDENECFVLDDELVLKGKGLYLDHFQKVKKHVSPMIDFLISQLKTRFTNNNFISNFDCLNIEIIKKLSNNEINKYGNKQITSLVQFYKQHGVKDFEKFDEQQITINYLEVKQLIKGKLNLKSIQEILTFMELSESYNQLYHLFKLFYIFPQTTVECERIFSQVQLILSKQRCNLSTEQLNTLLMISRNGQELQEFQFFEAIYHWKSNKKRLYI